MKKHSTLGKAIFWFGFIIFIFGILFNEEIGVLAEDIPEGFYSFSLPAIILGIMIISISNFFKKKKV